MSALVPMSRIRQMEKQNSGTACSRDDQTLFKTTTSNCCCQVYLTVRVFCTVYFVKQVIYMQLQCLHSVQALISNYSSKNYSSHFAVKDVQKYCISRIIQECGMSGHSFLMAQQIKICSPLAVLSEYCIGDVSLESCCILQINICKICHLFA